MRVYDDSMNQRSAMVVNESLYTLTSSTFYACETYRHLCTLFSFFFSRFLDWLVSCVRDRPSVYVCVSM